MQETGRPEQSTTTGNTTTTEPVTEAPAPEPEPLDLAKLLSAVAEAGGNPANETFYAKLTTAEDARRVIGAYDKSDLDLAYVEGLQYGGIMGAFELALFQAEDHEKALALAEKLKNNADTGKWICMFTETVETTVRDNIILFVMTSKEQANKMAEAFLAYEP